MSEKQFAKGVNVKKVTTRYGDIIKVGINLDNFSQNPSKDGWVNFDIKTSKNDSLYAELITRS